MARKTITFTDTLIEEVEKIRKRKGLNFTAFVIAAVDEKVRREKHDYNEGEDTDGNNDNDESSDVLSRE